MKYRQETDKIYSPPLQTLLATNPAQAVQEAESKYGQSIVSVSNDIISGHRQVILLTGPSASGKTTSAYRISHELASQGKKVNLISLDNFYKEAALLPKWNDGYINYESIEGLDTDLFAVCMQKLLSTGQAEFPVFDFLTNSRKAGGNLLQFDSETYLIIEGIHALNPLVSDTINNWSSLKIYISVHSDFVEDNGLLLCARDLRLIRRIIRDYTYRGSPAEETLQMWDYVLRGEKLYMRPFRKHADVHINSTHSYEPFLYYDEIMEALGTVSPDSPYFVTISQLKNAMAPFFSIDRALVPPDSLLREFIRQS